ncbi:Coenzyme F420 hydrogenase/dehydrogenase, beta subunit C-terminal domain [Zhenpiania hominis]|uniref:Coenzyme F420 hydrogenase/dehydrogenase, beta subunit C-terminal domain n=1 Tax=Zhenpiania hominis TaxID=2763644 RepID=A0A923SQG0_9FIRM|nr:Coenzyme F420 hydrogenase/dehydrogenase, beta subunit C-terminal domain [Zhenpiania hominis]MBC6679571.1 Coenzyme F420 hydrogenase/dehydrogenase, beta subunit C-terminal domain [Zhenpiania hominis]
MKIEKCFGCTACVNICPVQCLQMKPDAFGFLYPELIGNCIRCGLCEKVCPAEIVIDKKSCGEVCFAAIAKKRHSESTSGGIASLMSTKVIEKGGVAYGVGFKRGKCVYNRIDSLSEIEGIRGSKYVQAELNDTLALIKCDLVNHKSVLFVGTPCTIAGAQLYLDNQGIDMEKFIAISFPCGGVPSPLFLQEEIGEINQTNITVKFREGRKYLFQCKTLSGEVLKSQTRVRSPYLIGYDYRLTLRSCCYSCLFSKESRIGDITIGDFWGLQSNNEPFKSLYKRQQTASLIIITSPKGEAFFKFIEKDIWLEKHSLKEAFIHNPRLHEPAPAMTIAAKNFRSKYMQIRSIKKAIYSSLSLYDFFKEYYRYSKLLQPFHFIMGKIRTQ